VTTTLRIDRAAPDGSAAAANESKTEPRYCHLASAQAGYCV
jgi:hypothetical protein